MRLKTARHGIATAFLVAFSSPSIPANIYEPPSINGTDTEQLAEMVNLYGDICLKLFPDDEALAKAMQDRHATPMPEADVKDYLRDDQGVGWIVAGKTAEFRVTVEVPPFHACVIRSTTKAGFSDLTAYNNLIQLEEISWGGHADIPNSSFTREGTVTEASGHARLRPDGKIETLLIGTTKVVDPALAVRLTGIEVRFVHQIVSRARGT